MPASAFSARLDLCADAGLVTINYMDRSALGVVAQAIRSEFKLSPVEMGYLFSSFLWTYVVCLLPIGIMLDRYSAPGTSIPPASWCGRWPWPRPPACGVSAL